MSADSPRRVSRKGSTGHVVIPRPVSDPSIIDSLAGFIHDVVPQAYSSVLPGDSREAVVWARFEQADYNDPSLYPDSGDDCDATPPLLLVLGYGNGVQVWSLPASGEAVEVLSWNQRIVRTLRFLPAPDSHKSTMHSDPFAHKRPLVAIVDNTGPGPHFCSVNFLSLHGGDQVKSIKFKNPVNDVLANRRSIITTFPEKIAVFDALTLEDRMIVTTCYPCPGINPNPVSLGCRWLAYADRRLVSWWRSQGGCESEGTQSYTATVLHAAKSLSKGLRDLSGSVASSLTGTGMPVNVINGGEMCTPGIVTILDIEGNGSLEEQVIAHFVAHCEPIVALSFDPSGLLLLTVDKCGYRFHLFRIQPHPSGPSLSEVQHLYTLHRGDTSARIQDIAFSSDSRWVSVSSLRGTTHVFPITPYGGHIGVRTHTTPHVVNKLSRFHRSAGLSHEGGRNSPVAHDGPPLTPPLPSRTFATTHSVTVQPHAQLRHQAAAPSTEDAMIKLTACFAPPRACLPGLPASAIPSSKNTRRALDSLYVMACHGRLIQYDLEPRHISSVPKDRVCDDTAIELYIDPKAEWILLRPPLFNPMQPPLSPSNPLLITRPESSRLTNCLVEKSSQNSDEHWLSQVEIMTHAGPHRRLWMGPQFTFKTYSLTSSDVEKESVEVGSVPVRSNPVNMPLHPHLLIESGSASSLEQSPHLMEVFENSLGPGESRLREDLADAMLESPGSGPRSSTGTRSVWVVGGSKRVAVVERLVNPLGTVITIDPDASPALNPASPSSVASHPVADLIIVPAQSAAADSSSKVHKKVKCSVEVPHPKNTVNNSKSETSSPSVIKNTRVEKVVDKKLGDQIVLGDKVVGKNNSKEKRKSAKKEKRNADSFESTVKMDFDTSENTLDKPHVTDDELSLVPSVCSSEVDVLKISEREPDIQKSFKKLNKQKYSDACNKKDKLGTSIEIIASDKQEPLPTISSESDTNCVLSEIDTEVCILQDVKISDCVETSDNTVLVGSISEQNETSNRKSISVITSDISLESDNFSRLSSALSEKENIATKPISAMMNKSKRKCKTLGRKIKITEPSEKLVKSCSKLDEIDLLDSQQAKDSMLNDIPDLVLSNTNVEVNLSKEVKFDDSAEKEIIEEVNTNECLEKLSVKETHYTEEAFVVKSQNDETTDKDSSDDGQNTSVKGDIKSVENQMKKRKKSNRKQKDNGSDVQSDSDTNADKHIAVCETDVAAEAYEEFKKPVSTEEEKPKMLWSRIVSLGKQDANGNFSNADIEPLCQSDVPVAVSSSGNDEKEVNEKETNVKTNSTEDRGSVYESCSESVGEETQFEIAQQQPEFQEVVFDACEKTNSDNEVNAVNADSTCQNVDDDSLEKSNTDSGERDSGDGNRSMSKKARKQRRKRR